MKKLQPTLIAAAFILSSFSGNALAWGHSSYKQPDTLSAWGHGSVLPDYKEAKTGRLAVQCKHITICNQ